jgi:N-acyl-D-amino-acid deacylase
MIVLSLGLQLAVLCPLAAVAAGAVPVEAPRPALAERARVAVERSIALLQTTAAEYRRRRECFSCHHQALPVLAFVEARKHGFAIDADDLRGQLEHTAAHLLRGRDGYREGRGQGGQADTAGWALWTLEAGGRAADETTTATVNYLISYQDDLGHWRSPGKRPPTQGSEFTTTYVALRGLEAFGTPEQRERIAGRRERAVEWLRETPAGDTEDRVYRLRSLAYIGDEGADAAARELIAAQRPDGGWAQREEMESDAYATGSALAAFAEYGYLPPSDPAYRRGVEFLLRTQQADGSWHVATRSKPIQVYFESGFPHGKDQFVSTAATCWGVMALLPVCDGEGR